MELLRIPFFNVFLNRESPTILVNIYPQDSPGEALPFACLVTIFNAIPLNWILRVNDAKLVRPIKDVILQIQGCYFTKITSFRMPPRVRFPDSVGFRSPRFHEG
jgi:hypothetical protein